jgi:sulfide dehydrogenase cytochrome subunit
MFFARICIAAILLALSGPIRAAELETLTAECEACHGPGGVSAHSDMPSIAGQSREYVAGQLRSFKIWGRPCIKSDYRHGDTSRPRTDMCQIAEGLSEAEMDALADHYSAMEFVAARQEFDASLVAAGAALHEQHCETCHGSGGSAVTRGPILAGQWSDYLRSALKFVPTGEHLVPPMMERRIVDLSEEEVDALISFFASQQ